MPNSEKPGMVPSKRRAGQRVKRRSDLTLKRSGEQNQSMAILKEIFPDLTLP